MEKQSWPVRATGWTWRGIMILIMGMLLLCQGWEYFAKAELSWMNWLCLPVGIAGLALIAGAARLMTRREGSRIRRRIVMGCLSAAMGVLIFYSTAHYAFTPGWDPAFVYQNAYSLAYGLRGELSTGYFSRYPNNVLLTVFYSWIFKLAPPLGMRTQEYFVMQGFQCCGFALALYLIYDCTDRLTEGKNPETALWSWITGVALIGASPWAAVQYTDTASMILVSIEVWLFLKAREGKRSPLWIGLLGFTGAVGFRVKPQTTILLIAAALIVLLGEGRTLLKKENLKRTGAAALAAVLGLGLGAGLDKLAMDSSGLATDPEAQLGVSHYLKMGLNEQEMGGYYEPDVNESGTAPNRAERNRKNWAVIRERIRSMGFGGLLRQAVRKTMTNYGDGTFAWEQEGMFYSYDSYYFRGGNRWAWEHIPPTYIGPEYTEMIDESWSWVWRTIAQCVWLAVLFLGIFSYRRNGSAETGVLQLAILGLTLFQLLFEARARYLFGYAPVYVMLAGIGLRNAVSLTKEHAGHKLKRTA